MPLELQMYEGVPMISQRYIVAENLRNGDFVCVHPSDGRVYISNPSDNLHFFRATKDYSIGDTIEKDYNNPDFLQSADPLLFRVFQKSKTKCSHCGQYGEQESECRFCGSPID